MVFLDYRNYTKQKAPSLEAEYPTFPYVMPMSPTTLFFEVCSMYISLSVLLLNLLSKYLEKLIAGNLKKLLSWLTTMGICITKTYEEDWSWIPVGGSLPNTEQNNLAFGAAACMVHPATGYSLARSLSEAPKYASVIATILKPDHYKVTPSRQTSNRNMSMKVKCWFGLFGMVICILYRMSVSNCLKGWYPSDLVLKVFSLPSEI
ncbi:lycopene epsilon cyclase, chloroplastic-like [Pyrus x bretschneideri]|uniref:lycopene epsilon cyclase, chloroplastic-like n=1 Tax=Pyrus x bretschneideri TaxID=225117 RepID=UPI00202F2121|nr:lycopene epsilon cyclase, chloroplastic-like [Pyrus x bretschneideri]